MVAFIMTAMMKVQAQNFEGPCLPSMHGLDDHQSAFCGSILTQTIALSAGWTWISCYVDITLDDLKAALVDALGNTTIRINSDNGTSTYTGGRWRGTISWDITKMCKIYAESEVEIVLTGMPINPAVHSITIRNGANWIGYPFSTSMTLSDAFNGFALNQEKVGSSDGTATYTGGRWRGGFTSLEPGKGYIYYSNSTEERVFTFPTSSSKAAQK